jgi:hypothetical protein
MRKKLKRFTDLEWHNKISSKGKQISFGAFISAPSGNSFSYFPPEG